MTPTPDIILALDVEQRAQADALLDALAGELRWVKIGLQLFTRHGPQIVTDTAAKGYHVFLDLKLHDIPNTVASAIASLAHLPFQMLTLHTLGGRAMLEAAHEARVLHMPHLDLLGVTVLTSMDEGALQDIGLPHTPAAQVLRLAQLASACQIRGLVCSPLETATLRRTLPPETLLVTPGIRPAGAAMNDQSRAATPAQATRDGASFLVVGRPILAAPDPRAALQAIRAEITPPAAPR